MEISSCQIESTTDETQRRTLGRNAAFINSSNIGFLCVLFGLILAFPTASAAESTKEEVWAAELAFARAMAERNLEAFAEFVSEEAIFFSDTSVLRGKSKVVEAWSQYFIAPEPPFSWEPDQVEVLESGTLALSTGPVRDTSGKVVARFNSIWRLEGPNRWRVVFDKGSPPSPGPQ